MLHVMNVEEINVAQSKLFSFAKNYHYTPLFKLLGIVWTTDYIVLHLFPRAGFLICKWSKGFYEYCIALLTKCKFLVYMDMFC